MPRSARSSSTSRWERPNRRYQRTARVMTSGGKRYPAKAELGAGRTGGCRRDLIARVSLMPTPAANATVPPRSFFHPLLAALITGGARLMLALVEHLTLQEGISWALCDTDSMALARLEEMDDSEFLERATRI